MSFLYSKYLFTCKNVSFHDDGTVTYHNVFEGLEVQSFPAEVSFNLVMGIEYSIPKKGNRKINIEITDPDDNKITGNGFFIELANALKNQNRFSLSVIDVASFKLNKRGLYSVLVYHTGELIARHDFNVILKEDEQYDTNALIETNLSNN